MFYSPPGPPNFCAPSVSLVEGNLIAVAIKPLLVFVGNILCKCNVYIQSAVADSNDHGTVPPVSSGSSNCWHNTALLKCRQWRSLDAHSAWYCQVSCQNEVYYTSHDIILPWARISIKFSYSYTYLYTECSRSTGFFCYTTIYIKIADDVLAITWWQLNQSALDICKF